MKRIGFTAKCAAGALLFTGGAKILTSINELPFLVESDPVFAIVTTRQLLLFIGTIELLVASYTLRRPREKFTYFLLLWLGLIFLGYRAAHWIVGAAAPCRCLGSLGSWLGLEPWVIDQLAIALLILLLLVGSIGLTHSEVDAHAGVYKTAADRL